MLDPDYDDLWVADFPETIGGFSVGHISTPKDRACSSLPVVYLQSPQTSLDQFLSDPLDISSLEAELVSLPGVPSTIRWSFSPGVIDSEAAAAKDALWNRERSEHGCPLPWDDIETGDFAGGRGWAIFQNLDAGQHEDDNAQSVRITSPSTIGTTQIYFGAAINNTITHEADDGSKFVLQTGMQFDPGSTHGGTQIAWTDSAQEDLLPQEFTRVPYRASASYYFSNTYTHSIWWMCAGDDADLVRRYQCVTSPDAPGTHLIEDPNTSVWFENANPNSDWYTGFPETITVRDANIYRNGLPYAWTSETRRTVHNCGEGQYPVPQAMGSTTLVNHGTATWILSGVPLNCG